MCFLFALPFEIASRRGTQSLAAVFLNPQASL